MSFGRWLLVNSFSIFLLSLFFLGYIFRSELQLEKAYNQLFKNDIKAEIASTFSESKTNSSENVINTESVNKISPPASAKIPVEKTLNAEIKTVPTISTETSQTLNSETPDTMQLSQQERLYIARQAFWDKNYANAISLYQQLIQENKSNPDYPGELGNIYYSLNDGEKASRLYYQAAMVYIQQNQPDRARLLLAPIIAMNRELGEKLKFRLK